MPFRLDGRENLFAQARIADQFGIARGQGQVAFGQHHVHIAQQGAKEGPLLVHFLQQHQRFLAAGAGGALAALAQHLLDGRTKAIPAGQGQTALAPAEAPGNGAQVFNLLRSLAGGRA